VLIAEMLLLLAIDDEGRVPIRRKSNFTRRNAFMAVGLSGALLAELAIGGQLAIEKYGPVRAGDTRPADELLADVYDAVCNHLRGRKAIGAINGRTQALRRMANAITEARFAPDVATSVNEVVAAVAKTIQVKAWGRQNP
jgi:hypothetical protein